MKKDGTIFIHVTVISAEVLRFMNHSIRRVNSCIEWYNCSLYS